MTDDHLTTEGRRLAAHWSRYGRDQLDSYLIQEVEHPAVNPQSVLIRSFLADRLHPGRFDDLIERELYFSACATFALLGQRHGWFEQLSATLRDPDADNLLPRFMQRGFREQHALEFDVTDLFDRLSACRATGFDRFKGPFETLWRGALAGAAHPAQRPAVLELACGSANDYRFWADFGLGAMIDYTGVDVCPDNIANAAARFPGVRFETGDACRLPLPDREFDVVVAFDLYEHLSAEGLRLALAETARVGRDELWLSLFNAGHIPEHDIQPKGDYHWNLLSLPHLAGELGDHGYECQVVDVEGELQSRFPGYQHYDKGSFIMLARRM